MAQASTGTARIVRIPERDDDSVDGVLCRFGYMLVREPALALREE